MYSACVVMLYKVAKWLLWIVLVNKFLGNAYIIIIWTLLVLRVLTVHMPAHTEHKYKKMHTQMHTYTYIHNNNI